MRPKFAIANLLLFTAIVAMGAQMYRNHLQFQALEAELALHKEVRVQAYHVRQRELELQVAMHQSQPELQMTQLYQWVGFGDQVPVSATDSANTWLGGLEVTPSIGTRRAAAHVRNAELQLLRESNLLQHLEHDLSERFGGGKRH